MNRLSQITIVAGLALVVAGLAFGLVFSYVIDHEARLVAYDAYRPTFEQIAQDTPEAQWQAELETANAHAMTHRRASLVHTHSANMGILLILIGLLLPLLAQVGGRGAPLVWAFLASAWVYPAGLLLQLAGTTLAGQVVAASGAALAILMLLLLFRQLSLALYKLRS